MHAPNVTVALYIPPNGAPNAPDVSTTGALLPAWRTGSQENYGNAQHARSLTYFWTDILEVLPGADVRDTWPLVPGNFLYVPDQNGQQYLIVFVEGVRETKGQDYLRVYLKRTTWNTSAGGAAMEVKQASGTPDYLNISTLIIDQAAGLTLTQPAAGQARIAVVNQMSLDVDASGLKLKGDSASPGNSKLYGTDSSGNKGWFAQPSSGGARTEGTLVATGTNLATAAQIVTDAVIVSGANGSNGVILPPSEVAAIIIVDNSDASHSLIVYAPSGAAILAFSGTVASVSLTPGAVGKFYRLSSTLWTQ